MGAVVRMGWQSKYGDAEALRGDLVMSLRGEGWEVVDGDVLKENYAEALFED